ncbi:beta strand repeat-containing protein [Kordiimonas aquimaris]|uniref:beta strand repeat-containing protein n=1 Tax=Kordiimonas aquimaris TaxID=707591 RepID=UPI0021D3524F|nr:cadherin-like domain-containing protein [Kordiimonas aquimaris]
MCLVPSFPTNTLAVSPNSTNVALPDPTVTVNGAINTADIQITAFGGTVSLDTTGVTVTVGDGIDDQAITINGDNSALQTALATLTFTPTNGLVGEDEAHVQLSSSGAANSRLEIILINAPFITLSSAPSVAEDSSNIPFGNAINIDDATGDNQTVILTVTGGTFSIGNNAGLSYSVGNGFVNTTATFSGSLTDVNSALDTLVFTPTANLNGTSVASLRVQSDDGNGGTDDETLTFDITSVNDAPVIILPSLPTVNEDDTAAAVLNPGFPNTLLSITDVENDTLTATVTSTGGTFAFTSTGGVSFTAGSFAGPNTTAVISGSPAAVDNAIQSINFTPTADLNGSGAGAIRIQVDDGNGGTDDETITFDIGAVNDAPVITLPSAPSVAEDASNVLFGNALNIDDVEGDNQTVTLTVTGGVLSIGNGSGLNYSIGNGFANTTATFSGSLTDVNNALDTLVFTPTSNINGVGIASLRVQTDDGNGGTDDETLTFDVVAVNDVPTVSALPATVTVIEDTQSNVDLSAASIDDIDSSSVTVTLTASAGTFAAPVDGSAVGVTVALVNATTITLVGSPANINTYLDTASNIQYTGVSNVNGTAAATVTVTADDGNGSGDITLGTVNIDITAVNDAPTATDNTVTMDEDTSRVFAVTDFNFADVDTGNSLQLVRIDTLTVGSGTLQLSGVDVMAGDVITEADITAGNLVYSPEADANGMGLLTFTFSVNDGSTFAAAASTITVNVTDIAEAVAPPAPPPAPAPEPVPVVVSVEDASTGPDTVEGSAAADDIATGAGNDQVNAGGGDDNVDGGAGNDDVSGGRGSDRVSGGAGDDTVSGGIGFDFVDGGTGNDALDGDQGDDTVLGGDGNDTIDGGSNSDFLRGDAGDDSIRGGSGDDRVFAGPDDQGDDTVEGNRGSDIIGGGAGNDFIVGGDIDGNGTDVSGDDSLFGGDGDDVIIGGSFDTSTNMAVNGNGGRNTIYAGNGNDSIIGDDGGDTLGGGNGNDNVMGGAGSDVIYGGRGEGEDTLDGGDGDDQAFGASGDDSVDGGGGNDTLFGGDGNDTVNGGADNDLIFGGAGNDNLTGGTGNDTFAFITGFGSDTITDFGTAGGDTDTLDFSEIEGLVLADLLANAMFNANGATLTIGTHGTIILTGINEAELQTTFDNGQIVV